MKFCIFTLILTFVLILCLTCLSKLKSFLQYLNPIFFGLPLIANHVCLLLYMSIFFYCILNTVYKRKKKTIVLLGDLIFSFRQIRRILTTYKLKDTPSYCRLVPLNLCRISPLLWRVSPSRNLFLSVVGHRLFSLENLWETEIPPQINTANRFKIRKKKISVDIHDVVDGDSLPAVSCFLCIENL